MEQEDSTGQRKQPALLVMLATTDLNGEPRVVSFWYWRSDDSDRWMSQAKQMFPKAHGEELAGLALLPEDFRDELASVCGKKASSDSGWLVKPPQFSKVSESCSNCLVSIGVFGSKSEAAAVHSRLAEKFGGHALEALPGLVAIPSAVLSGVPVEDVHSALEAYYDAAVLRQGLGETSPKEGRACSI